jgi:hypothetical protein
MVTLVTRYKTRLLVQDDFAANEAERAFLEWSAHFDETRSHQGSLSRSIRIPMLEGQWDDLELRAKALGCSLPVLVAYCLSRAPKLVPGDAVASADFDPTQLED